jgi:hypothetical protein
MNRLESALLRLAIYALLFVAAPIVGMYLWLWCATPGNAVLWFSVLMGLAHIIRPDADTMWALRGLFLDSE